MRRIVALIRKEFLNEFSSPMSLVFFLVLPLLFTAAVGAGLSGMDAEDVEPQEVVIPLAVVQEDEGPLVDAFLRALAGVNVEAWFVEELPEEDFGLVIPADFSEGLLAGEESLVTLHVLPSSSGSTAVEQAVRAAQGRVGGAAIVARVGLEQALAAGLVTTQAEEEAFFRDVLEDTLAATEEPPAVARVRWPEGVDLQDDPTTVMTTSAEQASAGQIVTWVQITLLGAAEVLVAERLGGTLRRLLIMPASRSTVLLGKLLSRLVLGLVQTALLILGGAYLFGVEWGDDPAAVAAVSIAFAMASVGLGMVLATFVRTRGQASSAVVGTSMALAALGGAWYPIEITPELYRSVVRILPSTWAMDAYGDILARGATFVDVLPQVGVLLLFAITFTAVGMWRFRRYSD
jgi:ABC-2 type transport system permease protein